MYHEFQCVLARPFERLLQDEVLKKVFIGICWHRMVSSPLRHLKVLFILILLAALLKSVYFSQSLHKLPAGILKRK